MAGIQGHTVAEALTGVACALLYIVKVSLFFLFYQADAKEELEEEVGK